MRGLAGLFAEVVAIPLITFIQPAIDQTSPNVVRRRSSAMAKDFHFVTMPQVSPVEPTEHNLAMLTAGRTRWNCAASATCHSS
jgi:hypothetical protein